MANPGASSNWPSMMFFALGALATLAGIGAWQWSQPNPQHAQRGSATANVDQANPPFVAPVAYLTQANGCAWGGDSIQTWTVGHSVESGSEIALHEGIAEFRLANGVSIGVEGPASMLLLSPSKLVLQYGKVTAHVPWGADDFRVVLAGCRINARDAEFGVALSGNKLDVHVFSGEVTAASAIASAEFDVEDYVVADSCFSDALISAGRALQLVAQGEVLNVVRWDKAAPSQFVSKLRMSGPLAVTPEYVNLVKAAKPIGYWRFEKLDGGEITNEVPHGPSLIAEQNSLLVGNKENLSAELRWDGDWHLESSEKLPVGESDYSIEVWIKPSHLHLGRIASLRSGTRSVAAIELQGVSDSLNRKFPGRLRYLQTQQGAEHPSISCMSPEPYIVRRWQHVAAVKGGDQMKLYLDGKLIATNDNEPSLCGPGRLVVGNYFRNSRQFVGQLDELAIYDRALTPQEISQHYEAVNQAAKKTKPKARARQRDAEPKEV